MNDQRFGVQTTVKASLARRAVLRVHAMFLGLAGLAGMIFDFRGAFLGLGPQVGF